MSTNPETPAAISIDEVSDRLAHWRTLRDAAQATYGEADDLTRFYAGKVAATLRLARLLGYNVEHLA